MGYGNRANECRTCLRRFCADFVQVARTRRGLRLVDERVEQDVVANGPRAEASQVDRLKTANPAWPHVHIEVDDPAIPDKPSKGDSCGL